MQNGCGHVNEVLKRPPNRTSPLLISQHNTLTAARRPSNTAQPNVKIPPSSEAFQFSHPAGSDPACQSVPRVALGAEGQLAVWWLIGGAPKAANALEKVSFFQRMQRRKNVRPIPLRRSFAESRCPRSAKRVRVVARCNHTTPSRMLLGVNDDSGVKTKSEAIPRVWNIKWNTWLDFFRDLTSLFLSDIQQFLPHFQTS